MNDARKIYADIIDLPRPELQTHRRMPRAARSAQFAPFAALTGYDALIRESERSTDARRLLDEGAKAELDRTLAWLLAQPEPPEARFTVFVPDARKAGGSYAVVTGRPLRCDVLAQTLVLERGDVLVLEDLAAIECDALPPDGEFL